MVYKDMCNLYNKYNTKLAIMAGKYNTKPALLRLDAFAVGVKQKKPAFWSGPYIKYFEYYILSNGTAKLKLNKLTLVCELP